MISFIKIKNLFQIKSLIILSLTLGAIKLVEQFIKGKYFHDFDVYINAIKILNNFGNPYENPWILPYLYPPIVTKLLDVTNENFFTFFYIIIYLGIIFFVYATSNKKFKISFLISLGVSGILIKSLMTGNISNIFYFLIIISIFYYNKNKNFLPYYFTVLVMCVVKFNFLILFLLPIIVDKDKKNEFLYLIGFVSILSIIYTYQYFYMNLDFINFIKILKGYNAHDSGSSIFAYLNYKLEFSVLTSAFIHSSFFAILFLLIVKFKNKFDSKFFLLLILILLIFTNPRLKLYDVAFGIVFLNFAILYFNKKIILNFYLFNIILIFFIKEITKYFDLNIGNPKMLTWYIFILFFYYLFKKYPGLKYY